MRIGWVVYGGLEGKTGGTIYDACIIHFLRSRGWTVDVLALQPGAPRRRARGILRATERGRFDALVGDELCFPELVRVFAAVPRRVRRVLLVHHLTTWEVERGRLARERARRDERRLVALADRIVTTSRTTRACRGSSVRARRSPWWSPAPTG